MEGPNQNDELYPIAVLIDELKVGSNALPSDFAYCYDLYLT